MRYKKLLLILLNFILCGVFFYSILVTILPNDDNAIREPLKEIVAINLEPLNDDVFSNKFETKIDEMVPSEVDSYEILPSYLDIKEQPNYLTPEIFEKSEPISQIPITQSSLVRFFMKSLKTRGSGLFDKNSTNVSTVSSSNKTSTVPLVSLPILPSNESSTESLIPVIITTKISSQKSADLTSPKPSEIIKTSQPLPISPIPSISLHSTDSPTSPPLTISPTISSVNQPTLDSSKIYSFTIITKNLSSIQRLESVSQTGSKMISKTNSPLEETNSTTSETLITPFPSSNDNPMPPKAGIIKTMEPFQEEFPTPPLYLIPPPQSSAKFSNNPSIYECCTPHETNDTMRTNILYMKLHKCGSSTIQNILMRFGLRNELNFMLPKAFYYISYYEPFSELLLPREAKPPNGKYNILTHHTRYSPDIKKLMPNDTKVVTMLRSPASIFESLYNYFSLKLLYGQSFENFLKNPPNMQPTIQGLLPVYHGYNQMAVDLGFDKNYFSRDSAIREFIEFIDEEFDFVMIFEYFDESLVLLANLMGWPLESMVYLPVNSRTNSVVHHLTESDKQILQNLNKVDTILYNHFRRKFEICRQQYGIDRLKQEVQRLREMNALLKRKCVSKENVAGLFGSVSYDVKNFMDWECIYSTKLELPFTDELRFRQFQRIMFDKF